jgi:hypothetical protein
LRGVKEAMNFSPFVEEETEEPFHGQRFGKCEE